MPVRLPLTAVAAALGACLAISTASAQIPVPLVTVSARTFDASNTCDNAPWECNGATTVSTPGVMEFDVYGPEEGGSFLESVRFSLSWPEDWTALSWEMCAGGDLLDGDPGTAGSPITVGFSCEEHVGLPFLRLIIDCTTPGRFSIDPPPGAEDVTGITCGGLLDSSWGPAYVEVGDYCGRLPIPTPCHGYCRGRLSASFDPPALAVTLTSGDEASEMVSVYGLVDFTCEGPWVCTGGGSEEIPCFGGLSATEEWIEIELVAASPPWHDYAITVDAGSLPPGEYAGRVASSSLCTECKSNCMEISLVVEQALSAPDEPAHPSGTSVGPAVPNPTDASISIEIDAPAHSTATISLYDVAGRRVHTFAERSLPAGRQLLMWGVEEVPAPAGVYFLRVVVNGEPFTRRVVLSR